MELNTTEQLDTEEQRAFRIKAREWMAGRFPPRLEDEPVVEWSNEALSQKDRMIQKLRWEGGLAGITVPKEYGGLGLDKRFADIFYEEAEPYRLPWAFGNAFNIVLPVLLAHGSEYLKKRYIPAMLRGDHIWCQLLSEPSGGSDLAGVLTRAERRGDDWILNGSKIWTSGGNISDMGLCLARTDPTLVKHAGLTMFLVDMRSPGLTLTPIRRITGEEDFCQEFFDDVVVPGDHVVGEVNGGWTVAGTQLNSERAGMARGWHEGRKAAAEPDQLELNQTYLTIARELGLAEDRYARQLVGEAFVIDTVNMLTKTRVAKGIRSGALPPTAGAMSSLLVALTDIRRSALMSALTGPVGVAAVPDSIGAGAGLTRVTTHRIGGGTQEMQRNLVSERHLGLPREPSFDKGIPFNQIRHNRMPTSGRKEDATA